LAILATLSLVSFRPISAVSTHNHKKPSRSLKKSSWQSQLEIQFHELEKLHPNQIGLFIKDLNTGEEFSLHGDESWYLASTIKVPVAIEVLRQVDAKKLSFEDKIAITQDDYVDGNGPLKSMRPGEEVSLRFLIEQMIIWSDNMATDMLLRVVGLDQVNKLVKELSPSEFSNITSLKDVRRHIFSELHSRAFELPGESFIELRQIRRSKDKIAKFASLLQIDQKQIKLKNIDEAYRVYYQKGLNSATPRSYSKVLEAVWDGKLLSPSSRDYLMRTMLNTQTGKKRIRAGLKKPWVFAHKTGTQHKRICDVGYIWDPNDRSRKPIIIVSFVRDIPEARISSKVMEKVAKIISDSGVL
jgi:beta-lactamase class A